MNYLKIIEENAIGAEDSFIEDLRDGKFNEPAYWKLFHALNEFNRQHCDEDFLSKDLVQNFVKVQSHFQGMMISHYCPIDLFKIGRVDEHFLYKCSFRLREIFTNMCCGYLEESHFDDDLKPLGVLYEVQFKR